MRKVLRVIVMIVVGLVAVVALLALYVKKGLPHVAVVKELKVQATPARVARGEYLARSVAACVVCHSRRDESIYALPVKEGTVGMGGEVFSRELGFPGNIYAANLTPYHLGGWSDGELFRAITSGVSKDGHALFPIMNYPAYGRMDQEDVFSIIAYIRSLPAINHDVPATQLDFPLNFIVNTIPSPAKMSPQPDSNNASAYGKYLVTMASCVECHSKADKGKIIEGTEFGGGRDFGAVNGKTIYSANITPDMETGIGTWNRELFIGKFKQYTDSNYRPRPVGKGEFNTPMPWLAYAGMREKDLAAIYAYLKTVKPIHNAVARIATP